MTSRVPFVRLWAAVVGGYLALGATQQAVPPYVLAQFDASAAVAGTVVGVAYLATAVGRPFAGRLADRGHSRRVVMVGAALGLLGAMGHWWSVDVPSLVVARLVMGAGEAALLSGAMPWILAGAEAGRSGRAAGWFGLSMWVGLTVGPLAGSLVAAVSGTTGVWVLAMGCSAAALLLVASTFRHVQPAGSLLSGSGWRTLIPRGASLPGLVFGLSSYGYGTVIALAVLYLQQADAGGDALALGLFGAGFLVARIVGSPLPDRFGGPAVALGSLVVEVAGLTLMASGLGAAVVLLGTVLAGLGVALMYPAIVATTLRRTGALGPGTSVGVMTSYWDLGIMISGPLGGLVAEHYGFPAAFATASACSLLGIAVTALGLRRSTPQMTSPASGGGESTPTWRG